MAAMRRKEVLRDFPLLFLLEKFVPFHLADCLDSPHGPLPNNGPLREA
jgi:hypothetical protein